jgi:hypothetical protein
VSELKVQSAELRPVQGLADEKLGKKVIPLSGKLITAEDPLVISSNFRTLTNMRYGEGAPKSIAGMTKINSSAMDATYKTVKSAFQFRKIQPAETTKAETHVLAQAYNDAFTASHVLQNIAAPPATGDFVATDVWTDSSGAGIGRFSGAPNGMMAYCNGVDTCVWGGDGIPCTAFLTSSAAVTNTLTDPKDFSDVMLNTRQDAQNVATLRGGIDACTKLLIHANEADETAGVLILDSSVTPKEISCGGGAQVDTSQAKFGTGSVLFTGAGTNDFLQLADSADWFMGGGPFTIDFWVRFNALAVNAIYQIFAQYAGADNYAHCLYNNSSHLLGFGVSDGAGNTAAVFEDFTPVTGVWYHIAIVRGWGGTGNVGIAVNGVCAVPATDFNNVWPNLAANFEIGKPYIGAAVYFNGWIDEFRVSTGISRWTENFTPPVRSYYLDTKYFLVRSPLPLKGVKIYIPSGLGNTIASTMACKEWNGNSWSTLAITDNTDTGATLAVTGTVTWASTVSSSKPRWLNGYLGYWYQFSITDGAADIYYISLDAEFQQIVDIWDGIDRKVAAFFKYTTVYADYTLNVYEDAYDTTYADTYADLSSLSAFSAPNNSIIVGFFDRMTAFNIGIPSDRFNSTAATTMSVDYFGGDGFSTVGTINDGTSEGSISFAKSGTVSFTPPDPWNIFKTTMANNSVPLYYYRIRFDKGLDASTAVYYISGIPTPTQLRGYKFPLYSQDRLMLCCNMDGKRNSVKISAMDTAQVFNGDDSVEIEFGDENELTCGATLFAMYGSILYNISLIFKGTEMWGLVFTDGTWRKYRIAETIGCAFPLTLATCIVPPQEGQQQANRSFAIWATADGVYTSDGRHPTNVSWDIRDLFDQNSASHVNLSYGHSFSGFIDINKMEYHLLIALTAGTVTTLDAEYVLDLKKWQWFKVSRGTGKYLQCGVNVADSYGNSYAYGFIPSYMERLEYGYTFDSNSIISTLQLGDFPLVEKDYLMETSVQTVMLAMVSKASTTANVTLTHYVDTLASGTDYTIDPTDGTHRLAFPVKIANSAPGILHSFKMTITTDNETCAFEPLMLGIYYHPTREHDYV